MGGHRIRPGADVVAHVEQQIDVGRSAMAVEDASQDLLLPVGPLPAWRALAT